MKRFCIPVLLVLSLLLFLGCSALAESIAPVSVNTQNQNDEPMPGIDAHIRPSLTAVIVGSSTKYVSPLGSVTLEVSAVAEYGEILYQWYREDFTTQWTRMPLEGETGCSLTLHNVTDRSGHYLCRVEAYDGAVYEELYFTVTLENHLEVTTDRHSYDVAPGDSLVLSASASCDTGDVHYAWSRYDYSASEYGEEIVLEGENTASLLLSDIQTSGDYVVRVTDDYGSQSSRWFWVTIPNGLSLDPVNHIEVYAAPGESVSLSVRARCVSGTVSYRWYSDRELIPGAGGSTCTVVHDGDMQQSVHCVAMDQYQNTKDLYFHIYTASDLDAWPDSSNYVELEPGETAVLRIGTRSAGGSPLTYRWGRRGVTDDDPRPVAGAAGPSLTVDAHGGSATYSCTVEDSAGHTAEIEFYVDIRSGLNVDFDEDYTVLLGESATLQMDAWSSYGPVTYQWYLGEYFSNPVEGATSDTFSTGPLTESQLYTCLVSDGYEVSYNIFEVKVKDPAVTVTPAGSTDIQCVEGDEVTLAVSVSGITDQNVSYWWERAGRSLSGEEGDAITFRAEAGNVMYTCEVSVNDYPYTVHFLVSTSPLPTLTLNQPTGITFSEDAPALLSFTPAGTGMYSFSLTSGSVSLSRFRFILYDSDREEIAASEESPFSRVLSGGETYYLFFSTYDSSSRSGTLLATKVSGSRSAAFTLIAGQNFEFPKRDHGNTEVLHSDSDTPGVVRTLCETISAVSPGTAQVTVTYTNGYQVHYTVTVVPRSTRVLRVPADTGAVQAEAFEGDSDIQYVRLGQCLYVGSRAFAGTDIRQIVFNISSWSDPYIAPDAFAGSSPLIVGNGYMREFAEEYGFEFLMIRHEEGGNG